MKPVWLQHSPSMSFLYRFIVFIAWVVFKVFYRHRIFGLEHFYSGAAIIAANHTSYIDPPLLAISWPQDTHFLAKESLFRGWFGKFIRSLNAHPVSADGADIKALKTICTLLEEGKKVILFPEGTRSFTTHLGPIKPGIALLIARTQSAIIPAYLYGAHHIWGRRKRFPKLWGKTACVFGSPIKWEEFAHLDKKEAQQAILERFRLSMEALRMWYEKGAHGTPP